MKHKNWENKTELSLPDYEDEITKFLMKNDLKDWESLNDELSEVLFKDAWRAFLSGYWSLDHFTAFSEALFAQVNKLSIRLSENFFTVLVHDALEVSWLLRRCLDEERSLDRFEESISNISKFCKV